MALKSGPQSWGMLLRSLLIFGTLQSLHTITAVARGVAGEYSIPGVSPPQEPLHWSTFPIDNSEADIQELDVGDVSDDSLDLPAGALLAQALYH
ncbi:hypothetical protein CSUI_005539 [Cystoisospora suis]|uniref:Uncharacterized protein n=1 Tax=Cystoisospora suis TaxID=483139 RepID=A0A2C6K5J2_9APIC|nr:hypothetical protein CSUI_005539 [Cystoisospora suis]